MPTCDSEYIFNFLLHTNGEKYGSWNGTRYSNLDLDDKIVALASKTDLAKHGGMIADIWSTIQDEALYFPIDHQVLNWGAKSNVATVVAPDDAARFKYFNLN